MLYAVTQPPAESASARGATARPVVPEGPSADAALGPPAVHQANGVPAQVAPRDGSAGRDGEAAGGSNDAVIRRIERASGLLATKAVARMAELLPWYPGLSARYRADIQLVVQAGIASFVEWCRRPEHARELSSDVFRVAPRELVRAVSFRRLVDLVRIAVETIEAEVPNIVEPEHEQRVLADVLRYSRDIAFAGAVVYARVAEERGAWDARLEALVVDHVVRGDQDRALSSRAAAVGWRNPPAVTVVVGDAPPQAPEAVVDEVHRLARAAGLEVLTGVHNQRLVMVVGGRFRLDEHGIEAGPGPVPGPAGEPAGPVTAGSPGAAPAAGRDGDPAGGVPREAAARAVAAATGDPSRPARRAAGGAAAAPVVDSVMTAAQVLMSACGPGPVVVGPVTADLGGAAESARVAIAAADVVAAWPAAPRPVTARALLPERALAGDERARRVLIDEVYLPLRDAGAPLLETAGTYLDFGASLEATAKALYLHPNTVRYRLRKATEVCGLDTGDHRQRFTLHIALLLGRLEAARLASHRAPPASG
ncbi:helix-turn-helix domain-containing protein [Frankia sp. CN7]|uniref:helix-turn-helix domain-containing protein n=1 Tax=Frankia nepalensis TaxID=1836974 RepID=UPI001932CE9B|nr:helix-turn-helix domain-containing protein [Frankia nepalensis]MBL7498195.1 helix-turn-helix domain-containing protein [Frankia nepalensis]